VTGKSLRVILTDNGLAQLGDALLNFAFSMALTEKNGQPTGTRVLDKTLAEAAVKVGLRESLPRRVKRGDVANSLEALLGYVWIEKLITLDEIVTCLKAESLSPSMNFVRLADLALARMKK
jgi:hypothetical protein